MGERGNNMQQRTKNDKGYTLFLTLLITILFTVLAVVMVNFTMASMSKNKVREQYVQAQELSEKGLEHIVSEIQTQLQEKLGESGLTRTHFADELSALIDKYNCENGNEKIIIKGVGETGDYSACIKSTHKDSGNDLRREVVFLSKGKIDGKEKEIKTTIEIGAQEVPDALKYAIGSHKTCSNGRDCIPGEGNLFLHGGVSIEGDFKVDGDLITSNKGYAYLRGEQWIDSKKPTALAGPNARTSKLVLGGKIYTFNGHPSGGYSNHVARKSFSSYRDYKLVKPAEAFVNPPQLINRDPITNRININDHAVNYKLDKNKSFVNKLYANNNRQFINISAPNHFLYSYYKSIERVKVSQKGCGFWKLTPCYKDVEVDKTRGSYTMSGRNQIGQLHIDGDLTISSGTHIFNKGLYVDGDLIIGHLNSRTPNAELNIDGPIYVNGNLIVRGVNAKLNTLIYVNKSVDIQYSRINGLNKGDRNGSLIVFANDTIKIANNSVNEDTPSHIRGYFYSEDAFEMFGVGSNIRVEGGISARRIILNAVRGSASEDRWGNHYFDSPSVQENRPSRLQVIYNPEIINTYSDLKQQEPVIYNVDPPKTIERH